MRKRSFLNSYSKLVLILHTKDGDINLALFCALTSVSKKTITILTLVEYVLLQTRLRWRF